MSDLIKREDAIEAVRRDIEFEKEHAIPYEDYDSGCIGGLKKAIRTIESLPSADAEDRPQVEWNTHEVACLLADVFGDTCACNYNGIDEWLPNVCEFAETECPNPAGVACWEQYAKHRMTDMRGDIE